MKSIRAVYENGVFRPMDEVDLPENCEVTIEAVPVDADLARIMTVDPTAMKRVYQLMSEEFDSGQTDLAERHNEHQP
jgi:predicted DNA-binding antitoxin AbrB/MazE fold protein